MLQEIVVMGHSLTKMSPAISDEEGSGSEAGIEKITTDIGAENGDDEMVTDDIKEEVNGDAPEDEEDDEDDDEDLDEDEYAEFTICHANIC